MSHVFNPLTGLCDICGISRTAIAELGETPCRELDVTVNGRGEVVATRDLGAGEIITIPSFMLPLIVAQRERLDDAP